MTNLSICYWCGTIGNHYTGVCDACRKVKCIPRCNHYGGTRLTCIKCKNYTMDGEYRRNAAQAEAEQQRKHPPKEYKRMRTQRFSKIIRAPGDTLMRTTHTYVLLPVSEATFAEVKKAFEAADYHHAFHRTDKGLAIDMQGVALIQDDGKMFNITRFVEGNIDGPPKT